MFWQNLEIYNKETCNDPKGMFVPVEESILCLLREHVKKLLVEKTVDGFIGYTRQEDHLVPFFFTRESDINLLTFDEFIRYPLTDIARRMLKSSTDVKVGILARGCDERALFEMSKWNQVDLARTVIVGIACSRERAERCRCRKPYPEYLVVGSPVEDTLPSANLLDTLEGMTLQERRDFWDEHFKKCIKCYGCRNICPVCFCAECSLEEDLLITSAITPPEFPIFHLVRAFHMAGRCIDCGLCEEACPADIPLRTLYKKVNAIVEEELHYTTGLKNETISPLNKI